MSYSIFMHTLWQLGDYIFLKRRHPAFMNEIYLLYSDTIKSKIDAGKI